MSLCKACLNVLSLSFTMLLTVPDSVQTNNNGLLHLLDHNTVYYLLCTADFHF